MDRETQVDRSAIGAAATDQDCGNRTNDDANEERENRKARDLIHDGLLDQ